jgi:hypothetical protein
MKARNYTNTNENKNSREEQPVLTVSSYSVKKARTTEGGIVMADVVINGITIYGMKILANKSSGEAFLSWPSQKGRDGKYYSIVWARLADADQERIISDIYTWLDSNT